MQRSRREFMRHAGLAALLSPFMSMLDPRLARAAPGDAKYLFIFFTNGTDTRAWSPASGSSDTNITFSAMTEPLAPIKDKLILIEKLDSNDTAGQHAQPGGLTGQSYGGSNFISIDQFVADGLLAQRHPHADPQPHPGRRAVAGAADLLSRWQEAQPHRLTRDGLPGHLQRRLARAWVGGAPVVDNRTGRRASILSLLKGEINQLLANLGGIEREKLDIHLASIEQLEARITAVNGGGGGGGVPPIVTASCATPALPGGWRARSPQQRAPHGPRDPGLRVRHHARRGHRVRQRPERPGEHPRRGRARGLAQHLHPRGQPAHAPHEPRALAVARSSWPPRTGSNRCRRRTATAPCSTRR